MSDKQYRCQAMTTKKRQCRCRGERYIICEGDGKEYLSCKQHATWLFRPFRGAMAIHLEGKKGHCEGKSTTPRVL